MKKAVILFNLGGPDKLESVEPFLFNLFNDPAIISIPSIFRYPLAKLISKRRAPIAKNIYKEIGNKSPILELTQDQAKSLENNLLKAKNINKSSEKILSSIGLEIDPKIIMEGLSIADQQMIEIAGALSKNSKILIMDEPTSPLTPNEVGKLFEIVNQLKSKGMAIIFISHRLEEIRAIADCVTIFRDGDLITTKKIKDITNEEIIKYMIGRSIEKVEVKENDYLTKEEFEKAKKKLLN